MNFRSIFSAIIILPFCMVAEPVKWLRTAHDFGAFSEDIGAVDAVFEFVNTTSSPVRIIDARATCGCTVPQYTKDEIAPGDTAAITATYLASGRPGKFSKNIYVRTSAEPSVQQTLTVSGTVIGASSTLASRYPVVAGPLRLKSSTAAFGEVLRNKMKTLYIEAYNMSTDTVRPQLSGLPDFITGQVIPAEVAPGEQTQIVLTLQTASGPEWGVNADKFVLKTAPDSETELDYFTIVTEDFSTLTPGQRINAPVATLTPERVNLGEVSDMKPVELTFELKNSGKLPLEIRRVQTADPVLSDVKVSTNKVKPGKTANITLTFSPSNATSDFVAARLTVICNDPENPLLTSRITAEINDASRKQ